MEKNDQTKKPQNKEDIKNNMAKVSQEVSTKNTNEAPVEVAGVTKKKHRLAVTTVYACVMIVLLTLLLVWIITIKYGNVSDFGQVLVFALYFPIVAIAFGLLLLINTILFIVKLCKDKHSLGLVQIIIICLQYALVLADIILLFVGNAA